MSVFSPDPALSQPEPDRNAGARRTSMQRPSPGEALRRHPLVVLAPALILAVLGALFGLHASTTYTASAQLVVQPLAPTVSQLPSAVQAAEDQATNESRLILSSGVTGPLAQEFSTTPSDIAKRLSATPIPSSTVITLDAEADSAHGAVTLANAAAATFAHYVNTELQSTATVNAVLKRYETAEALLDQTRNAKLALEAKHVGLNGLVRATSAVAGAQVRASALSDQYESAVQALATAPTIKPFSSATKASSNRRSQLELYALGGLLVGLLIGAAMAIMLANRRVATAAKG
jgi:capsular polysaccharide biosynthesis protein